MTQQIHSHKIRKFLLTSMVAGVSILALSASLGSAHAQTAPPTPNTDTPETILKKLPAKTRPALGEEAGKVRRGEAPTRAELEAEASRLNIKGRSKMGKADLKRAVAQAKR